MADLKKAIELHNNGDFSGAEPLYLEYLEQNPDDAYANNLLGLLYSQTENFDGAEKYIKKAIEFDDNVNYIENLGVCYYLQKKYEQAMPYFEQVIERNPKDLDRIRDFAKLAKDSNQWDYAIKFYSRSFEIDKRDYVALNNIGLGYEEEKQFEKAKSFYERSLRIKPNYHAYHNLGVWYRRARNFKQSVLFLKRALAIQPDNIDSMISIGMSYLSMRDMENGYKYYQHRCPKLKSRFHNEWDGQEHKSDTLAIYFDGGRGDQLMFCRYLPFIKEKFKNVVFAVYDELIDFFKLNYPDMRVCSINDIYLYDYSVNVMELHYKLGMDFEHIPFADGYLKADEQKIEKYRQEFFNTDKFKVGLFWQGNMKVFPYRSMKLKEMSKLFDIPNCQFYSFQKGAGVEQLDEFEDIINVGKCFDDYTETAAALKNLDVLVTIDSSILHMAGALGVKTLLFLPHASEWRWFDDTQTTPWYSSVEIFKQEKLYDWQPPVDKVFSRLKELSL